jgi:hypothetical protein
MRATIRCLIAATPPARPHEIIASDDDKLAFITDYGSSVSVPNTISVTAPGRQSKTFLMLKGKSARRSRTHHIRRKDLGGIQTPTKFQSTLPEVVRPRPARCAELASPSGQVSGEESRKSQIMYWCAHRKS